MIDIVTMHDFLSFIFRDCYASVDKNIVTKDGPTFCRCRTTKGTNVNEKYRGKVFRKVADAAFTLCARHD